MKTSEDYLDDCDPEAIRFDDLDEAIVGTDHRGCLVYDYDSLVELFVEEGMQTEDAVEWISYNVIGTMGGEGFTIMYK